MRDYDIESDLKQEKFQSIKLVQGDRGNKIKINVYEDGQPVNLAGCSVTAKYKRADGEVVDGTVENKTDNYFYAVMDNNITKVAGTLKMLFNIENGDVKVSTFLLLADVREGIGENTGSSGGDTEVTVDLKDYQKKTDNGLETKNKYIVGAINEVNSQCKDIANYSLIKHTDGKIYIKKQDGTLIGTGVEIGNDTDLSKITMSMSGQTLKLMNDGKQVTTVDIPTAVITDEQLTDIIQSKIDDGTLTNMTIKDNSITPQKTDFLQVNERNEITTTWASSGYMQYGSDYIDITNIHKLYLVCTTTNNMGHTLQKINFFNNDKKDISIYTPDTNFYIDNVDTIYTKNADTVTQQRNITVNLDSIIPSGCKFIKIHIGQSKADDITKIYTGNFNLDLNKKYLNLVNKYEYDNIDVKNVNFMEQLDTILIDYRKIRGALYGSTEATQFGGVVDYFPEYINTTEKKEIYIRVVADSQKVFSEICNVACYDANKVYVKTLKPSDTNNKPNVSVVYSDIDGNGITLEDGTIIHSITVAKLTIDEDTKFIRLGSFWAGIEKYYMQYFAVCYANITNYTALNDTMNNIINSKFKNIVNKCITEKSPKSMICIGDSLTNWGGGTDSAEGFLKIVHDKLGVITTNAGKAGATWQTGDGQDKCAVNRVDNIISQDVKYDVYCFIMGTNGGSSTDTGEDSSNKTTMCGAIRYCMEKLKAFDPTGQILVCLPPQRAEGNDRQKLVNDVIKKIVEDEYSIRTLDLYRHSGVVPNTTIADINYLTDGLHLNTNGRNAIGNALASEVKYMLCL